LAEVREGVAMALSEPTRTILVIEDDDVTRVGFGEVLTEHGYRVVLGSNGRDALGYLRDHPAPDLIILDMLTPGMDGWQFLKERDAQSAAIPVLITTALSIANDEWAISLGAIGVLHKPIDLEVLLEIVAKTIGSG
jgi:CheY-like chemotaxis protein